MKDLLHLLGRSHRSMHEGSHVAIRAPMQSDITTEILLTSRVYQDMKHDDRDELNGSQAAQLSAPILAMDTAVVPKSKPRQTAESHQTSSSNPKAFFYMIVDSARKT